MTGPGGGGIMVGVPSRASLVLIVVVLADVVSWVLTVHGTETYHRGLNGPTVMSLGDVLGWMISVGMLIVAVLMIGARMRRARAEAQRFRPTR